MLELNEPTMIPGLGPLLRVMMENITYAQAVGRNNLDPRLSLLDPLLAEIRDGLNGGQANE